MPSRHGVSVSVTNTSLEPLAEHGSQIIGRHSKLVSTHIEAINGLQFYVRVSPEYPFPISHTDASRKISLPSLPSQPFKTHEYGLRQPRAFDERSPVEQEDFPHASEGGNDNHEFMYAAQSPNSYKGTPAGPLSTTRSKMGSGCPFRAQLHSTSHSPAQSSQDQSLQDPTHVLEASPASGFSRPPPPLRQNYSPFDLTASVYIDGRAKPECRQVIYLDPAHPKYNPEGFVFRGRWITPPSSTGGNSTSVVSGPPPTPAVGIRNWVFTDVGIEVMMSRMELAPKSDDAEVPTSEVDRVLDEITSAMVENLVDPSSPTADSSKPGQITVKIRRIVCGAPRDDQPFKPYHYAGDDEVADARTIGKDCTHTTSLKDRSSDGGVGADGDGGTMKLNTVPWVSYKKGEEFYVKFTFLYMSRAKLHKLGLCDEAGSARDDDGSGLGGLGGGDEKGDVGGRKRAARRSKRQRAAERERQGERDSSRDVKGDPLVGRDEDQTTTRKKGKIRIENDKDVFDDDVE